jgi:hypothetical protein
VAGEESTGTPNTVRLVFCPVDEGRGRSYTVVMSRYAPARSVSHLLFNHTSFLQMMVDRFAPNGGYSAAVDIRRHGASAIPAIHSLTEALSPDPRLDIPELQMPPRGPSRSAYVEREKIPSEVRSSAPMPRQKARPSEL